MTPGWGGRPLRAFLSTRCGLMRSKGAAAPHAVCANRGGLLFFIVIFYRCLCETMSQSRFHTPSGCRSAAKGLWTTGEVDGTGARPALSDKGDPKLRIGARIVFGLLFTMTAAADHPLRHCLGLKGLA